MKAVSLTPMDPDQELLDLARRDIGLSVAMKNTVDKDEIEAKQSAVLRRMRELQRVIVRRRRRGSQP
jgi:hypothetical protein